MFVSGVTCNFIIAMVVGRINGAILLSTYKLVRSDWNTADASTSIAFGCAATGAACVLTANMPPHMTYWAYGFPAATIVVIGADLYVD